MNDTISRQTTIDYFVTNVGWYDDGCPVEDSDELRKIWTDLFNGIPPSQPEQTGCEYCHEDVDGYVKPIEKNCHAFVRFGMNGWVLELKAKGWHGDVKIQYCPMCGRKFKNDKLMKKER